MANSYRCSPCDVNWPASTNFATKCPVCGTEVWANTDIPLTHNAASELVKKHTDSVDRHERFENYYAEREVRLLRESLDSPLC